MHLKVEVEMKDKFLSMCMSLYSSSTLLVRRGLCIMHFKQKKHKRQHNIDAIYHLSKQTADKARLVSFSSLLMHWREKIPKRVVTRKLPVHQCSPSSHLRIGHPQTTLQTNLLIKRFQCWWYFWWQTAALPTRWGVILIDCSGYSCKPNQILIFIKRKYWLSANKNMKN